MSHIPAIVSDLMLILIIASVVTILFKWLKQPVVLGYIVAGFLISPHFVVLPSVADITNINVWAEIGIIFLLFALGLEFSFKRLMDVGVTAAIATVINMGSMIAIGFLIGEALGWSQMESLFLGGMLSMSSTTIIIKAFSDSGLQKRKFAGIVFGMLIVEDLAAILMMVLLSTVAVSQHFEGTELVLSLLKLIFFVVIWFVVGISLIPSILKKLKKFMNDETLLIFSIGLCFGMVYFADAVGFSAALGAFIMGSILSGTMESKKIEHLIEPLKNLFGAVFFVSVGMMIVPEVIVEYAIPILILTVVVLIGRVIFATLGVLASGQGLKVALQSGFSLAQIGEFSFIIATFGMQLGVIGAHIYPIIVAVSVITTFTTPYFIKISEPVYKLIEKRIPAKHQKLITGYGADKHKTVNTQSDWQKVLRVTLTTISIYFILAFAVFLLGKNFVTPYIISKIPTFWGSVLAAGISISLMTPFIAGMFFWSRNIYGEIVHLWKNKNFNKGVLLFINLLRVTLCIVLILMVLIPLFSEATSILVLLSVFILIMILLIEAFRKRPQRMEKKFFHNLNQNEIAEQNSKVVNTQAREDLLAKNIHIEKFEISPNTPIIGMTLKELDFKRKVGVSVLSIIRGERRINIPTGDEHVYPFDKLVIVGSDDELQSFMKIIEDQRNNSIRLAEDTPSQIWLSHYIIEENSPLIGRSIKGLQIRERTNCMIISIERDNNNISDIKADFVLQEGDILCIAGEKSKLSEFEDTLRN